MPQINMLRLAGKCSVFVILLVLSACKMPEGPLSLSGDVPEAEGWKMEVVVDSLEHPWSVVWITDNEILITERPGRLRRVFAGKMITEPVSGVPDVFADGQGGLLDVSLHPNFNQNRYVYITYASGDKEQNRTTIARGNLIDHTLVNVEVIFQTNVYKEGNQHFGSRMAWLPDSTFLVSVADGGNYIRFKDGGWIREQAQNTTNQLGSVVNLTDDGNPAPNGPFVERERSLPELWSYGHRNIQGLAYDSATGRIWANEHGSRGGDELNLLVPGGNYGWPVVTYSREYHYPRISKMTTQSGMIDPIVVWTPAQAPSGLVVYHGDKIPSWKGNIFSGGLRGQQVRRITLDGEMVTGEEKLTIGSRVRDVRQGPDGYLYILTDEKIGKLIRILPTEDE